MQRHQRIIVSSCFLVASSFLVVLVVAVRVAGNVGTSSPSTEVGGGGGAAAAAAAADEIDKKDSFANYLKDKTEVSGDTVRDAPAAATVTVEERSGTPRSCFLPTSALPTTTTTTTCPLFQRRRNVKHYHYPSTTSTQDAAKQILEAYHIHLDGISDDKLLQQSNQEAVISSTATTTSTSTVAKSSPTVLAVTATQQTNGRGTNQRQWLGAPGNTFATICLKLDDWNDTHVPLTLLPLLVGLLVAKRLQYMFQHHPKCNNDNHQVSSPSSSTGNATTPPQPVITLKWPNDVLINQDKIAGILIESATSTPPLTASDSDNTKTISETWFLIGIGINVMHAPTIPTSGKNQGRPSTSLVQHCPQLLLAYEQSTTAETDPAPSNSDETSSLGSNLGVELAHDLVSWIVNATTSSYGGGTTTTNVAVQLIQEWKQWVDWGQPLVLRNDNNNDRKNEKHLHQQQQTVVIPQDILPDGRLKVQQSDGTSQIMVSDYFF